MIMKIKQKKLASGLILTLFFLIATTSTVLAQVNEGTFNSMVRHAGFLGVFAAMFLVLPGTSMTQVLEEVMEWLLQIFTYLSIIAFIITGIMYLYAGANNELKEKAKDGIKFAIIGIVVGLSGYIVLNLIDNLLSVNT